ncbi:MAG: ribosome maturation factor RimP [Desulfitobacteriaceae bacterium]|nr:ribosome maturation factor RimP [Desulfitobacteriaceae bacterium]MDD4345593.1 ribosome maturation factor RimP [Desulfitobacteriaceae bacterium]MDD4400908.1 ribosome maturation factor RimP [Desulfitobacteriaceae bacterium]
MNQGVEQRVSVLAEPLIKEKGLELVDVEYMKEGAHWYLRLFIDKEGSVDIDDCTEVSHAVSELLDTSDVIPQSYILEVSSPGLERPLKKDEDFRRFQGKLITINTNKLYKGYQEFSGYLIGLENEEIILEYEGKRMAIPRCVVKKAQLSIEF